MLVLGSTRDGRPDAIKYRLLEGANPARGERLKAGKPAPVWLDSAKAIQALLAAAGELDAEARADRLVPRKAVLATLVFSGLRIGELIGLRWRDVDLAAGWLVIGQSKTDAGRRRVSLLPALRDELAAHKAASRPGSDELVFVTRRGGPLNEGNIRRRILGRSVRRANERLEAAGLVPLPEGLTPHKLRHSFCSLLVGLGVDPGQVMDELGHTDPTFTLGVYRHAMRRDEESKAQLRALVGGEIKASIGTSEVIVAPTAPAQSNGHATERAC